LVVGDAGVGAGRWPGNREGAARPVDGRSPTVLRVRKMADGHALGWPEREAAAWVQ
jgi:hypothetical protein